jgi:hypothetical protein
VGNDPVNKVDPKGLDEEGPDGTRYCHATGESYYPWEFDLMCPRPNPSDFNPGCQPGTQLPPCEEAAWVKPRVPPGNKYTVAQVQALANGLNEAIRRTQDFDCFSLFTAEPDAGSFLAGILANTEYRFLTLPNPNAAATTASPSSVFVSPTGAFFAGANPNGTVTVAGPNATGERTLFTFAHTWMLQAFILLHELGHQTRVFGPDVDAATNGRYSQAVLERCFTRDAQGVYR